MKRLTKPLESGADYVAYCRKNPEVISTTVSGDHFTFTAPDGRITICNNRRELAPWLRRKIWLELVAIGLGIVIVAILILPHVA